MKFVFTSQIRPSNVQCVSLVPILCFLHGRGVSDIEEIFDKEPNQWVWGS